MLVTEKITAEQLYQKLKDVKIGGQVCQYSREKCEELTPLINEINELKREKNACILVHSYVTPEIIYGVGDYVGDSYILSKRAMETEATTIVFAAVRFMGDTAKILNPHKDVLIPGLNDGCTLADSINARVDWTWAQPRPPRIGHGWRPENGFIPYDWGGYNEAMIVYLLALGSPTYPVSTAAWPAWTGRWSRGSSSASPRA